ncbi:hypothetical protein GCM10027051_05150 [Niabella terrae]
MLYTAKALLVQKWQVSWLTAALTILPIIVWTITVDIWGKALNAAYSCATAREFHTVPYYPQRELRTISDR